MRTGAAIERLLRRCPTTAAVVLGGLYAAVMWAVFPYRQVFEFDRDEGINAGKARLLDQGYALYTQVWNDQPPLFTHLLRAWFDAFGWHLAVGRGLVLLFGAALVFAVYDLTRLEAGHRAALFAASALAASAYVPRLSVSLMIGLPAVALATLAVWAVFRWRHAPRAVWLVVSGMLFGGAVATKLFVAFLLPIVALWLVLVAPADGARLRPAATWLAAALLSGGLLLVALAGPDATQQLLAPHLSGELSPALRRFDAGGLLLTGRAEWLLTLLGVPACAWLAWQRRTALLIFPAWVLAALVALLGHVPFWYHHQLLLSVPYCPAIGVCVAEWTQAGTAPGWARLRRGAAWAAASAVVALAAYRIGGAPAAPGVDPRDATVAALRAHLGARRVALSSDPTYAFRAGAAMPPGLAVLSQKRAAADPEFAGTIAAVFAADAPEAVTIGAGDGEIDAALRRGMGERYAAVFSGADGVTVFARRDLDAAAAPPVAP